MLCKMYDFQIYNVIDKLRIREIEDNVKLLKRKLSSSKQETIECNKNQLLSNNISLFLTTINI